MKKFFKRNLFIILPIYLLFIFVLICSLIKTDYEITSPGLINKVENVITVALRRFK